MKNSKATFAAIVIVLMLGIIDFFMWQTMKDGFFILSGSLACYGYFRFAADLTHWLARGRADEILPPVYEAPRHRERIDYKQAKEEPEEITGEAWDDFKREFC